MISLRFCLVLLLSNTLMGRTIGLMNDEYVKSYAEEALEIVNQAIDFAEKENYIHFDEAEMVDNSVASRQKDSGGEDSRDLQSAKEVAEVVYNYFDENHGWILRPQNWKHIRPCKFFTEVTSESPILGIVLSTFVQFCPLRSLDACSYNQALDEATRVCSSFFGAVDTYGESSGIEDDPQCQVACMTYYSLFCSTCTRLPTGNPNDLKPTPATGTTTTPATATTP